MTRRERIERRKWNEKRQDYVVSSKLAVVDVVFLEVSVLCNGSFFFFSTILPFTVFQIIGVFRNSRVFNVRVFNVTMMDRREILWFEIYDRIFFIEQVIFFSSVFNSLVRENWIFNRELFHALDNLKKKFIPYFFIYFMNHSFFGCIYDSYDFICSVFFILFVSFSILLFHTYLQKNNVHV